MFAYIIKLLTYIKHFFNKNKCEDCKYISVVAEYGNYCKSPKKCMYRQSYKSYFTPKGVK